MRLCRIELDGAATAAFYAEDRVIPVAAAAAAFAQGTGESMELDDGDNLLQWLPQGMSFDLARRLAQWLADNPQEGLGISTAEARLLVPNPRPNKLFLLAGNYAAHIEEGGGIAAERAETFPYVFMKPPTTTLTHPGDPVRIPTVSPHSIDWELELGVIIGRTCRNVTEAEALDYVAGFTVVNDISDRQFRPNPERAEREKDGFFDWLHGKWHDSFCPQGPAVLPAEPGLDPQTLGMQLRVNGQIEQDASTADMVFPVAAIVEFISGIVTLEPGDIISTGTPAGVGAAKGRFLKPGDALEAEIEGIGVLRNPVV